MGMILTPLLAKLLGLSAAASLIGMSAANPFFIILMIPFVKTGDWLTGTPPPDTKHLLSECSSLAGDCFHDFSYQLLMGVLAWFCLSPFILGLVYASMLPISKAICNEVAQSGGTGNDGNMRLLNSG